MKTDRRDFFKKTSVAGLGLVSAGLGCSRQSESRDPFPQTHRQRFNMAGYSAPQLDLVRIGVIGIGERGRGTVMQLGSIEGVEIRALCDLEPERVKRGAELILDLGHKPDLYSGGEEEWKKVCDRSDIDVIAIVTPWHLHTIQAAYAMEHDKHVYTQLTAANTIDECWQLVETSERTRKHCTQTSASCHSGIHAVNLNMVRQGFFGLLIHAEGNYIHQLNNKEYFWNPDKGKFHRQWRLNQNIGRQGNLYAGHGFTPIVQMMHINYGDKIDYISSFQSNDFSMNETAKIMSDEDDFWKPWLNRDYRGNMNYGNLEDPTVYERVQFIKYFSKMH